MLGSRAAVHWLLLRQLLRRHELERGPGGLYAHAGCLRVAVADSLLKVDRRLALPLWLLQLFQVGLI